MSVIVHIYIDIVFSIIPSHTISFQQSIKEILVLELDNRAVISFLSD